MRIKSISWGVRITIVYTTFALGTLAWVVFSMMSDVELVRPDYYEYSLQHDKTMRAEENAAALGAGANITVDARAVILQLPTSMVRSQGTVTLYRPNSAKLDHTYTLALDASGVMRIPYKDLPPGQWDVIGEWRFDGKDYKLTQRALF